jgi:histidinol-phosphate aminotransferase
VAWHEVPYRIAGDRVDPDLDAVAAAIDRRVRAVYLTSPSNPGGAAIDHDALARFVAAAPAHVAIVVDEAYVEYAARPDALDAARLARATDRPLIVLRSCSKFHALAGLRIGYAIAPPELARRLARAAPPFVVARGAEQAAIAALSDTAHAQRTARRFAAARARVLGALAARGIPHLATDAPFVLAADPDAPGPRYFDRFAMIPIHEDDDG